MVNPKSETDVSREGVTGWSVFDGTRFLAPILDKYKNWLILGRMGLSLYECE